MNIVHPVVDEWTEQYALYAASAERVLLSTPVATFIEYTRSEGKRPVLLTGEHAGVSSFVSRAMRQAGGHWAVKADDGGVFDAASGYRIGAFEDMWLDGTTDRERHPAFQQEPTGTHGELMFDVFSHHRAVAETRIGPLAEHMLRGLGGERPQRWDSREPLGRPWGHAALTDAIRLEMPQSETMLAANDRGDRVDVSVGRTKRGILEHVTGSVPAGAFEADMDGLLGRASETLTTLIDAFSPTIAFVSYAEADDGELQRVTGKRPEVPLAVLIGPRGVRDLAIDFDALAAEHDVVKIGRDRVPSLLVRFSGIGPRWHQLIAFGADLDAERLVAAVAPELSGGA